MKREDIKTLQGKSIQELEKEVAQRQQELERTGLEGSLGKQKNIRLRFIKRKELAQILTVLRLKQLQGGNT